MGIINKNGCANEFVSCPHCKELIPVEYDDIGVSGLSCPKCNNPIEIEFDESQGPDSDEWFETWFANKI